MSDREPINTNQSPYFNDYDKTKNYVMQLAVPERGAQAREYTQLQSMYLDFLQRMGDSLFKDGNVVQGCEVAIRDNKVYIGPGKIYLKGLIREIDGAELDITGVGEEIIGCRLIEEIITEVQDASLYDPATGSANHLHPGCHRLKQTVEITLNDELSAPIVRLINGEVVNITYDRSTIETLNETLARRTYDESGNYVVEGMELRDINLSDDDNVYVTLTKGKAYVRGYEIEKPTDNTFPIPKSLATRIIEGEPKVKSSATQYPLIYSPVQRINEVVVTATKTENVTRGTLANGADALSNPSIVSIDSVVQGGTTYTINKDFLLRDNKVDWYYTTGIEPEAGSTYTVTYKYKRNLIADIDYTLEHSGSQSYLVLKASDIVSGTEILIDYVFYLSRKDIIALNQNGEILVIPGEPDLYENIQPPFLNDDTVLSLGTVSLSANSSSVEVYNNTVKVSKMSRIQNAINRLNDLEYNIAVTNLDREAMDANAGLQLRGIFTDNFMDLKRIDLGHEAMDISLNSEEHCLIKPFTEIVNNLAIATSGVNNYGVLGDLLTLPYTTEMVLSQSKVTQSHLVNPYQVFPVFMDLNVIPRVDNWIDTTTMKVEEIVSSVTRNYTWWSSNLIGTTTNEVSGSKEETIMDEAILYMRQRTVQVVSETFPYNQDNIQLRFDGRIVPLTPQGTSRKGTVSGSVTSDANGKVSASFVIPQNIPCGTKEVELFCSNCRAFGQYSAEGRKVVKRQTIFLRRVIHRYIDPIAQTFQLDDDYIITNANVYFKVKDNVEAVTVQIRTVVNGYPSNICLGECVLLPSQINVSEDGSVPTQCTFDMPVQCEKDTQYAIVVMTDSPIVEVFVAKLGDRDLITGQYITTNAYFAGVMFSSSNALTWTAHQEFDLKFDLFRAKFSPQGQITFNTLSVGGADRLLPIMEVFTPVASTFNLNISLNNATPTPFTPWVDRNFNMAINSANASITMATSKDNYSPFIIRDTCGLVSFINKNKGVYISKFINVSSGFNELEIYLDRTSMGDVKVFANWQGTSTWTELEGANVQDTENGYIEYKFFKKGISGANSLRVKIEMTTENTYDIVKVKRLRCIMRNNE